MKHFYYKAGNSATVPGTLQTSEFFFSKMAFSALKTL
jgi:hypothetical protein